jgi:hypothetical protein
MIENMEQFSAMVLAADYSWSARYDPIAKLGYDPAQVFRKLYFGTQRSVVPVAGLQFCQGAAKRELVSGDIRFKVGDPVPLRSLLSAPAAPTAVDLSVIGKAKHIALAFDSLDKCDDGEVIANLSILTAAGKEPIRRPIRYGREVRSQGDAGPMPFADRAEGLSVIELPLPPETDVRGVHLEAGSARGGLRVYGIALW